MLIEGDIELKYSQVRECIQTFDDFYVFLLSLYEPEFPTSEKAQFYLNLFADFSNKEPECLGEHDNRQIKSFYDNEFSSSESVINCSLPFEEKFVPTVTDNILNEEFSIPRISVDCIMVSCNSLDAITSEKQIIIPSSNMIINIDAPPTYLE